MKLNFYLPEGNINLVVIKKHDLVEIKGTIKHETKLAYLIYDETSGNTAWVPKSIAQNNNDGTFTMPRRFAEEKEFEEDI